jgi:hypothetical protein
MFLDSRREDKRWDMIGYMCVIQEYGSLIVVKRQDLEMAAVNGIGWVRELQSALEIGHLFH